MVNGVPSNRCSKCWMPRYVVRSSLLKVLYHVFTRHSLRLKEPSGCGVPLTSCSTTAPTVMLLVPVVMSGGHWVSGSSA